MNTPAQRPAPAESITANLQGSTLNMPAIGGAIVLNPGTNFANSSQLAPCLEYEDFVFRTQVSGSSEILQSKRRTDIPLVLPK